MASTYSTRIRLEKQGDGENANTWGLKLNQNVIDLVDEAVAGFETINIDGLSSATLTSNDGTVDQSRNFGLRFIGTLAADCTVVAPSTEKVYFVGNDTIGGHNVVMKSGTATETVYSGSSALVAFNGTNSIKLDGFEPGTRMMFQQTAAPTGWTKDTTHNDKALRITNGTVETGGTNSFSTSFASYTPDGSNELTIAGHSLSVDEMPVHKHDNVYVSVYQGSDDCAWANNANGMVGGNSIDRARRTSNLNGGLGSEVEGMKTSDKGGGAEHTHTGSTAVFTGVESTQFAVQYVDVIIATKD